MLRGFSLETQMIKQITVEPNGGWFRYKSETPIDPGTYFQVPGRPSQQQRKALSATAATDPNGRFVWLAPAEPWVQRLMIGKLTPQPWRFPLAVDWAAMRVDPDKLRAWQRQFLSDAFTCVARGFPYHRAGVVTLGGGKTLAGLALCQLGEVAVVAASTYLHSTWREEAAKWNMECPILSTYESIHKAPDPDVLIIDESLALKNPDSLRHRRVAEKAKRASIVVGFTGTPTSGVGPLDWRWLRVIEPGCAPAGDTAWRFLFGSDTQLVEVVPGRNAYQTSKWKSREIAEFVEPFVYSADTSRLLDELPEIEYRTVAVPQPADWTLVAAGGATTTTASKRVAQCRQISDGFVVDDGKQVVRVAHTPKLDAVEEWVDALGEPVIIYAAWTGTLDLLAERLAKHNPAMIRGDTGDPGAEITRFKSGLTNVLLANARYSSGMNLQERCRIVAFVSWSLNPTDRQQAIGRVYRPGQKHGVQIVDFVAENTLDARTLELIQGHQQLTAEQVEALLERSLKC